MAKIELAKKEFDVLVALERVAESGGLSQRELVEKTGLSLGTVNHSPLGTGDFRAEGTGTTGLGIVFCG